MKFDKKSLKTLISLIFFLMLWDVDNGQSNQLPADKHSVSQNKLKPGRSISIHGSYRLRGEIQDGYNIRTFGTDGQEDFLLSRLRLETDVRFSQYAQIHLQLQDARVVGSSFSDDDFRSGNNPFHDPLDINQAYFEFQPAQTVKLTVGRQAIAFRDRRVFGPGNWGNTGRYAWDAIRLTFSNHNLESNWLVGRFILHQPDRWLNKQAQGPTAYACYNTIKTLPFQCDVFYVFKDDRRGVIQGEKGAGDLASHSVGMWLKREIGNWDVGTTVVGQFGRYCSDKIRAMGAVFSLGRKVNVTGSPFIQLQYIRGSGDKNPNDGVNNTFDGVFGGADTDLYGWMNLFFWKNINEYRINMTFSPGNNVSLRGEYHYFRLDQASDAWYFPGKVQRRDVAGLSGQDLGHEIDLTCKMKVTSYLELLAGTCFFLPGEFIKNTGNSPQANWYFLQTTFNF